MFLASSLPSFSHDDMKIGTRFAERAEGYWYSQTHILATMDLALPPQMELCTKKTILFNDTIVYSHPKRLILDELISLQRTS